jgi:hypothetical protein
LGGNLPSGSSPGFNPGVSGAISNNNLANNASSDTDLLAVVAVPSAVLIATLVFFGMQTMRAPAPKFYPQAA